MNQMRAIATLEPLRAVYTSGLDIYDLDLYVKTCV